jgi:hypothetical protein
MFHYLYIKLLDRILNLFYLSARRELRRPSDARREFGDGFRALHFPRRPVACEEVEKDWISCKTFFGYIN